MISQGRPSKDEERRGLIAACVRVWQRRGRLLVSQERQLRVLETLPLGGRRQVHLVACGAQKFLVGTGADAVTSIVLVTAAEGPHGGTG